MYFSWFGVSKLNYFAYKKAFLTTPKININIPENTGLTALVAPLDWGLGHATRCVPLIEKLLIVGFKVIIAAEGDQKILLQQLFPMLEFIPLTGYSLKYGTSKSRTRLKIILQIPKILTAINKENRWLAKLSKCKHLDAIFSDNRFGLFHPTITSVFITHQLLIKTSFGDRMDRILQRINYRYINRFQYCWVPDGPGAAHLAGELSHPAVLPSVPVIYTGIQSRLKKETVPEKQLLLILLPGPEPQRTILEKLLLHQLAGYKQPVTFVRGLPANTQELDTQKNVTVYNFLSGTALQRLINEAEIVISRAGYSSVMDLLSIGKKCIFIPTPGQAEQEYLAAFLSQHHYACVAEQHNFLLEQHLRVARQLHPPDLRLLKDDQLMFAAIDQLKKNNEQKRLRLDAAKKN